MTSAPTPVVGLRREREVLTVALATGRHVVIEGPPGTGKSTLLRSIARDDGRTVVFVEGNAELTPARLVGQFDPSQVLAEGYLPANFVDGPLLSAMRGSADALSGGPPSGGLLYLEELNRVPEETLNVLITVLTEGEIAVPRLGTVHAGKDFRLIAAMNPFDAVGTARVSQAIADRMCRVVLGYQDEPGERQITSSVSGLRGRWVDVSVALTRATREHRDVRMGSSVRGAIDLALVLAGLAELRGEPEPSRGTGRDAAYAALSGRIRIADGVDRTAESVIDELLDRLWPADPADPVEDPADGRGKAEGLPGSPAGFEPRSRPGREQAGRTQGRQQLAARHPSFEEVSPQLGELDPEAFDAALAQDPEAAAALLADMAVATDAALRAAARRLAGRVFVQLGRVGPARARGTRRLGPSRGLEGDLDLDRTLDRWQPAAAGRPGVDDIVTRSWTAHRRAVCLVVDVSGSMQGLAVALASVAAAGVVVADETGPARLEPSVLAFGTGVRVLQAQGVRRPPEQLLCELVALRGHGTTDLAAGLREASRQLAGAVADERLVVLLSDCLHTAGGDPAEALGGIDRLHVLVPLGGAEAEAAAAALAARGGGRAQTVRRLADVAPALTRVLA